MPQPNPLVRRLRNWQSQRADEKLFRQLARVHELGPEDMEQLVAIADHYRLVRLSEVFVRPSLLQGTNLPNGPTLIDRQRLSRKIFGELPAPMTTPPIETVAVDSHEESNDP